MSEIDVSECCYYDEDNSPFCCELYDNECEAQNCYFQQLQQLKAENEELKKIRENLHKCNMKIMDEKHNVSIKNIKYKQCLDEIEEIVKNFSCENCKEFSRCLEKRTQSTNSLKIELSYLSPYIEERNKIIQMIPSPTRCDVALEKVILQKIKEVKG